MKSAPVICPPPPKQPAAGPRSKFVQAKVTKARLTGDKQVPIQPSQPQYPQRRRDTMVLGILGLMVVTGIPTTIGVSEAISAQKKQDTAAKEKARFHMTVDLSIDGGPAVECSVVLGGGRLFIDHPQAPVPAHKFSGYYFTYPGEEQHLGLVSTIAEDPPMLNWIFVDKDTGELRHGARKDSLEHLVGPWGWSEDERWLTLEGQDTGFVAVEDAQHGVWSIFLDRDADEEGQTQQSPTRAAIKLRRKMVLGMDSKWVRDSERDDKQ